MKKDYWILKIFILTFILSLLFSTVTNVLTVKCNDIVLFIILLIVIVLGIIFDMVGTSAVISKESTFHSMSSSKIKGSKEALSFIKHKDQIASICNDVIGDICGIISGGLGAVLAISLSSKINIPQSIMSIIIAAFISSLTVGGKAIFKRVAIKKADNILYIVGKIKYYLKIK